MKYLDYNGLNRFWTRIKEYIANQLYVYDKLLENLNITKASYDALSEKADASALTDGSVTKVGKTTVGSGTRPIYLSAGVPTASSSSVGDQDVPVYLSGGQFRSMSHNLALFPRILFRGQVIHNASSCGWNKNYLRCMFSGFNKSDFVLTRTAKGSIKITPPAKVAGLCTTYDASIVLENMGLVHVFRGDFDSDGSIVVHEYDINGALADGGFNITVLSLSSLPDVVT